MSETELWDAWCAGQKSAAEGPRHAYGALSDADIIAALEAEIEQLRAALREVLDTPWIENALDPQQPARIARAALESRP